MLARTKRWTIATILSVAAFAIAGGAALAGGAAARGTAAAAPPVAGKACARAGATGTAKGGVKLVCTKAAKSKKLLWVVAKPTAPAKPTTPATPATATTSSATGGASADLIAKGKDLFLNGAGSQGIACARCHGANALGDTAPKIAGKKESEIRTAVSTVGVMVPFFGDLPNDQILAIAAYLQSLVK